MIRAGLASAAAPGGLVDEDRRQQVREERPIDRRAQVDAGIAEHRDRLAIDLEAHGGDRVELRQRVDDLGEPGPGRRRSAAAELARQVDGRDVAVERQVEEPGALGHRREQRGAGAELGLVRAGEQRVDRRSLHRADRLQPWHLALDRDEARRCP